MLSLLLPLALACPGSQAEPTARIELRGSEFVLRMGRRIVRVPLKPPPAELDGKSEWPPKRMLFRKDAAYAVWDARGLSVRQKSWVFTTNLPEIPTSPKLFSRKEILQTKEMIDAGKRQLEAADISGALRDGSDAYFLVRWEEKGGKPWLEALVKVDLKEEKPKPKLVGRFDGLSLDLRPGMSRLFIRETKPAVWVKSEDRWGLALFDPSNGVFEFKRVGGPVDRVELVIERTGHPSRILCRWDKATLAKRELVETRGSVKLLDDKEPWIAVLREDEGEFLQNLDSGARQRLPKESAVRRTEIGILVWSPEAKPKSATLYELSRWTKLGSWAR
jgi:hypothetical protein